MTISSPQMARLPDTDLVLRTTSRIASAPTAPYHEFRALRAIDDELRAHGITAETDA